MTTMLPAPMCADCKTPMTLIEPSQTVHPCCTQPPTRVQGLPLPRLALCPCCEGEARVKADGTLYQHNAPTGGPCGGTGRKPAAMLPPTFRRWLNSHRGRSGCSALPVVRLLRFAEKTGEHWQTVKDLRALVDQHGGDYVRGYMRECETGYALAVSAAHHEEALR